MQASESSRRSNLRTHAQGLKVHGPREDVGRPLSRALPSPEWSGAGGSEAAQTPTQPCTISLLQAPPPPLLLFICLITKQKLQSRLLYFCM